MAVLSAPTVILSIEDSLDSNFFCDINEEELEDYRFTLREKTTTSRETSPDYSKRKRDLHTIKKYLQPHLNLIFPPPEFY